MKEILVRYMFFPDIENGVSGFYEFFGDKSCVEPSKPYKSGQCHIVGEELDDLSIKVGFMTRKDFAKSLNNKSWKNAFGRELSQFVGKKLEDEGIKLNINGAEVQFSCPKNEFVTWPGNQHKSN